MKKWGETFKKNIYCTYCYIHSNSFWLYIFIFILLSTLTVVLLIQIHFILQKKNQVHSLLYYLRFWHLDMEIQTNKIDHSITSFFSMELKDICLEVLEVSVLHCTIMFHIVLHEVALSGRLLGYLLNHLCDTVLITQVLWRRISGKRVCLQRMIGWLDWCTVKRLGCYRSRISYLS